VSERCSSLKSKTSDPPLFRPEIPPPLGRPIRLLDNTELTDVVLAEVEILFVDRIVTLLVSSGRDGRSFTSGGDDAPESRLYFKGGIVIGRSRRAGSGGTGGTALALPTDDRFN